MSLEDDGVGIAADSIATSNGIKNIMARAEKIHAALTVGKMPEGTGTRVQLVFKITKKNTYDDATQKTRTHR